MAAVMPIRAASAPSKLEDLVDQLINAKRREDAITAERIALEEQIIALVPPPQEGSETVKTATGFKLTVTGKLIYKADLEQLLRLAADLPENLRPLKTETKADETGLKYLRKNEPELWNHIAPAIEIKPAKVAVKVAL